MLRRHPAGHLFVIRCDTCPAEAVACGDSTIEVAQIATSAGWTIGTTDRCRDCPEPEAAAPRKRAA